MRSESNFLDYRYPSFHEYDSTTHVWKRRLAVQSLARILHLSEAQLWQVLIDNPSRYYRREVKRRPDGSTRELQIPIGPLREIQQGLKRLIRQKHGLRVSPIAHGFVPGRSILSCIEPHRARRTLVEIDLQAAYVSVDGSAVSRSLQSVFDLWGKLPWVMADFLTYDGPSRYRAHGDWWRVPAMSSKEKDWYGRRLPQGGPCSPWLFNLACRELDDRLEELGATFDCIVTRYADNIFISSREPIPWSTTREFIKAIDEAGFWIQRKKFRYQEVRASRPLTMFGINISWERLRLTNTRLRRLRLKLFNACQSKDEARIWGIVSYVRAVNGSLPSQIWKVLERFGLYEPRPL